MIELYTRSFDTLLHNDWSYQVSELYLDWFMDNAEELVTRWFLWEDYTKDDILHNMQGLITYILVKFYVWSRDTIVQEV